MLTTWERCQPAGDARRRGCVRRLHAPDRSRRASHRRARPARGAVRAGPGGPGALRDLEAGRPARGALRERRAGELLARLDQLERMLQSFSQMAAELGEGSLKEFLNPRLDEVQSLTERIRDAIAEERLDEARDLLEQLSQQLQEMSEAATKMWAAARGGCPSGAVRADPGGSGRAPGRARGARRRARAGSRRDGRRCRRADGAVEPAGPLV